MRNLIEFFVVARNVEDGHEEWFRSLPAAASAVGVSVDRLERAIAGGRKILWLTFRKEPALYRVVSRTGQELVCTYDRGRKLFVTVSGGVEIPRRSVVEIEECYGDVQG